MANRVITIRGLEDFAQISAEELPQCLHAFGDWVLKAKMHRMNFAKIDSKSVPTRLETFSWRRRDQGPIDEVPLTRTTPIEELNLKPTALCHLREMRVFCLEDCAEVFVRELQVRPDIGQKTISKLREKLLAVGLDFKDDPDPARALLDRSRAYRQQPLASRKAALD